MKIFYHPTFNRFSSKMGHCKDYILHSWYWLSIWASKPCFFRAPNDKPDPQKNHQVELAIYRKRIFSCKNPINSRELWLCRCSDCTNFQRAGHGRTEIHYWTHGTMRDSTTTTQLNSIFIFLAVRLSETTYRKAPMRQTCVVVVKERNSWWARNSKRLCYHGIFTITI